MIPKPDRRRQAGRTWMLSDDGWSALACGVGCHGRAVWSLFGTAGSWPACQVITRSHARVILDDLGRERCQP
jgi:hypothetical protein